MDSHNVHLCLDILELGRLTRIRESDLLEKKIILATESFTTKFSESTLRDKLSKENALAVADYIIAMKREINSRLIYIKSTIQFLSELSRVIGIEKHFVDMTRDDILFYLDKCRKPENEDPLHKWIGSYNLKRITLMRFFKWLYYHNIASPKSFTRFWWKICSLFIACDRR